MLFEYKGFLEGVFEVSPQPHHMEARFAFGFAEGTDLVAFGVASHEAFSLGEPSGKITLFEQIGPCLGIQGLEDPFLICCQ